jgi:hypothetical protein
MVAEANFSVVALGPKRLPAAGLESYPPSLVCAMRCYRFLLRFAPLRYLLLKIGPAFELRARAEAR